MEGRGDYSVPAGTKSWRSHGDAVPAGTKCFSDFVRTRLGEHVVEHLKKAAADEVLSEKHYVPAGTSFPRLFHDFVPAGTRIFHTLP